MGNAGLADVFISYTGRDWGWASWLDFTLREAGYATKMQGYDFMVTSPPRMAANAPRPMAMIYDIQSGKKLSFVG